MMKKISQESMGYLVSRLLKQYAEAIKETKNDKSDFAYGRRLAYYEVLDILKSELDIHDADLKDFGLDVDLESIGE